MKNIGTLKKSVTRVRPLSADLLLFDAISEAWNDLCMQYGADEIVIVEKEVVRQQPEDHLLGLLQSVRPDVCDLDTVWVKGRKLCLVLCAACTIAVNVTALTQAQALQQIIKEVL